LESTLRDRHGPLRAALLTAPLFALQHVSLVAHNGPLAALLVMTVITALAIPFRALIGTAYNATGSLFIAGLVHAMGNATTNGGSSGVGFLPRLYAGELLGILHQVASAALGIAVIIATRGRLELHPRVRAGRRR
jgi:membrane protease YdiL (CAAX protease family)